MEVEKNISAQQIWQILEQVTDPEIPVLSIVDLGIVRDVRISSSPTGGGQEGAEIFITPTYSGCPAMDVIAINIRMALLQHGVPWIKITQQLSPAWTTDWMTEKGKEQLRAYGIAPPQALSSAPQQDRLNKMLFSGEIHVVCPQCQSTKTKLLSEFGSTACKALYQCQDCKEPFDYFKCH